MKTSTHDFVTVEMRGLKAGLVARAQAERVSVSVVVRRAVERELGLVASSNEPVAEDKPAVLIRPTVKVSLRLTSAEAHRLACGARRAGLSRGAFLAGFLAGVPALTGGLASRSDCLVALHASCTELSTLSRNIHHLTSLLRQGQGRAALDYRLMLDNLRHEVRSHLSLASSVLAELRPARQVPPGRAAGRAAVPEGDQRA